MIEEILQQYDQLTEEYKKFLHKIERVSWLEPWKRKEIIEHCPCCGFNPELFRKWLEEKLKEITTRP